jgi:hypothetical protein
LSLVPMEKGGTHKFGSELVVIQTHEKLESMMPLEKLSPNPSRIYVANIIVTCVSKQHE